LLFNPFNILFLSNLFNITHYTANNAGSSLGAKKPRGNDSQHRCGFRQGSLTIVDLEAVIRGGKPSWIQLIYNNVKKLVKG
jgi:hypothetical protein